MTQLGCRAEYRFQPEPARNGTEAHAAADPELERYLHLHALNRGVLLTPFHNMALMAPDDDARPTSTATPRCSPRRSESCAHRHCPGHAPARPPAARAARDPCRSLWAMAREQLIDGHGRAIRDVRVSVTDRCNFRCQYCMPAEGLPWLERDEVLTLRGDRAARARCCPRWASTTCG